MAKKNQVAEAVNEASDAVFEVEVLRDIIAILKDDHDGCEHADTQIAVLEGVVDEKLHHVFHLLEAASEGLTAKPKAKKTKAVVKTAAAA
jgi:hypothetical protein